MIHLWETIFYTPLYNGLIFLIDKLPGHGVGLAILVLTVVVKLILYPLSYKAVVNQIEQKKLQPLVDEVKRKYPDKKEQSEKTLELYKTHKMNPFAGCLSIIIQLPIILALYHVFLKGVTLQEGLLYKGVMFPETFNMMLFGLIDLSEKSIVLAVVAGISQFLQLYLSPSMKPLASIGTASEEPKGAPDMMTSMQKSMKYTLPVMIAVFAYLVPSAIALYWIITNIFTIAQEIVIRKRMEKKEKAKALLAPTN